MKAQSNIPFPIEPQRWKEGQYVYFFNHMDNGVQEEEKSGSRYEADYTVMDELSLSATLNAITRKQNDPILEQKVVDNIQLNGSDAILATPIYQNKVSTAVFPALPSAGLLTKGSIYSYSNGAVMVVQDHFRTIYAPELTPALFSFYREITEGQPWITGEQVALNATRTYNGKAYRCIQAHQSQETWSPELTLGVLWVEAQTATIPVWKQPTGGQNAYKKGDKVHFPTLSDPVYESLIDANVWSPTVYPAGWRKL